MGIFDIPQYNDVSALFGWMLLVLTVTPLPPEHVVLPLHPTLSQHLITCGGIEVMARLAPGLSPRKGSRRLQALTRRLHGSQTPHKEGNQTTKPLPAKHRRHWKGMLLRQPSVCWN